MELEEKIYKLLNDLNFTLIKYYIKNQSVIIEYCDKDGYLYNSTYFSLKNNKSSWKFSKYNKYTILNIKKYIEINNLDYNIIDKYFYGTNYKAKYIDKNGYYYGMTITQLTSGSKIQPFGSLNPYSLCNIKKWCQINNKRYKLISRKFINSSTKMTWRCLDCGEYFDMRWGHIQEGIGCPYCAHIKLSKKHSLMFVRPNIAKEWNEIKNGVSSDMIFDQTAKKYWWKCSFCNSDFYVSPNARSTVGCPSCSTTSTGEEKIKKFLDDNNIDYQYQKTFDGLKDKNPLHCDFYLEKYNLVIEFQGIQHYKSIGFFGGDKSLISQQSRDNIKREYFKENNIFLLEIPYYDFNNIEEMLKYTMFL